MKIERHPNFQKSFRKRIANDSKLINKTGAKIKAFQQNPSNPVLKDHPLKGSKRKFRAFSITGDIRIIYQKINDKHVVFYDIGTHNQVYRG